MEEEGKYVFGVCTVGEKGQIVIPARARKIFNIKPGDNLLILGDIEKGMALTKVDVFHSLADEILGPTKEKKEKKNECNRNQKTS